MLSQDPVEILHFLGMRVEGFWTEPFPSVDALFEYVATCRLFWVRQADDDTDIEAGVLGGEEGKRKLKANDRRRMKGRPIYRQWCVSLMPDLHGNSESRSCRKLANIILGDAGSVNTFPAFEPRAGLRPKATTRPFSS